MPSSPTRPSATAGTRAAERILNQLQQLQVVFLRHFRDGRHYLSLDHAHDFVAEHCLAADTEAALFVGEGSEAKWGMTSLITRVRNWLPVNCITDKTGR